MRWMIPLLLCAQVAPSSAEDLLTTPWTYGNNVHIRSVGYSFTVKKHPLRVTRLGVVSGSFQRSVNIGIWNEAGALIASTTVPVPINNAAVLQSGFWWVTLPTSVTLEPYTTYRVATQGEVISYRISSEAPTGSGVSSAVTVNNAVLSSTYVFTFPNLTEAGIIVGPNVSFDVLPYDTTPPVITLNGANPQTVFRGTAFTDLGATVTDDFDATRTITGSGAVDTTTVGSYTLTYSAQDEVGNAATPVTRTVEVVLDPNGDEDKDGLNNTEEAHLGTSPYLRDTDSDGVNDLREVGDATDPLDPASFDPLNLGLVAYYPFNGDANDESGNSLNATIYNPANTTLADDRFSAASSAYQLGQAQNGVDPVLWGTGIDLAGKSMTISFWAYGQFSQAMDDYVGVGVGTLPPGSYNPGGTEGKNLHIVANWQIRFSFFYNDLDAPSSALLANRWHHLSCTYDEKSKVRRILVNGKVVASDVAQYGFSGTTTFSMSGRNASRIDDVRFYNRALAIDEIAAIYADETYAGFGLEGAATKSPFDPATASNWSAGGTEWIVDTATTHDGVDSVKAQTTNGQSTFREYTVTGPAVVDFWWKVSSEELYDTFSYSINGDNQQTISGEVDWAYRTLTLPAGTHTIRWTYTKDGSDAVGQDAGWLDDFAVYPATAALQVRDGSTVLDGEVTVDFGSADVGSTGFTKTLTFANNGYVPLEVQLSLPEGSPFTFDGGAATYDLLVGRGESVALPITLATTAAGTKSAQLTITAPDIPFWLPPIVTLSGYVRGPDIGLAQGATTLTSGQTFDMGLAPRTVEFTIRNNGNVGDLVISAISATGNFQITQQPATTIPPQGNTTFKVLAQSIASGTQTGSISITSNAANLAEFSLPLSSKSLTGIAQGITDGSMATSGTGGAVGWDFATTQLPSGQIGQALKTGTTPNNGGSALEFTTQTAGVISWSWKVGSQENFDWLLCEVDGQEVAGISTKNGVWQTQVVNVPAGANVRWVYRKDASASAGEDAGYLADVEFRSFAANQSFGQWAQSNGVTDPLQRMPKSGLQAMFGWLGGFGVDGERDDDTHQAWILSGTLKYRYPISKTANGTQQILFSPNMSSWTTRRFSQRVVSEDANRIVIEATAPSGTKGFFKVVGDGYISSAMIEVQGECFAHPIKYQIEHDQFEVKLWFQSRSIGKTLQECLDQIAALGLRYNEEEVQELINQDRLQSVFAGTAVASFQLGKTEITWAEWQEVRDWAVANGYSDLAGVGAGSAGNHPVRDISWYDAVKWANAKSEIEGLSPVYFVGGGVYRTGAIQPTINPVAKGYRLPTEIEWEWAAMGGVYTSGFAHYIYSGSNDLELVGWFTGNAGGAVVDLYLGRGTWPVAQKAANELGLYDMSGNVWEWVDDVVGSARRLRGGGWPNEATECTIISRVGVHSPDYRHPAIGFRLARNAD